MTPEFTMANKVAMVTAAGSGIGREIAVGASQLGASVVVVDVNGETVLETAELLTREGGKAIAVVADCRIEDDILRAFGELDRAFGRIDILFSNVGGSRHVLPENLDLATWNDELRLNLTSTFLAAREAGRRMLAQGWGGSIVAMSSIGGSSALGRGSLSYDVSKAGVQQLCRELAVEWGRAGIRVNVIQPAQTRSAGWLKALNDGTFEKILGADPVSQFVAGIPLGRLGEPHEIASVALFLASDLASWVTGVCIPVDGGNLALNAGGTIGAH